MSKLDTFLAGSKTAPTTTTPPVPVSEPDRSAAATPPPVASEDAPRGVVEITLPSGIDVYYQAAPKRLYRLRAGEAEWIEVPSMSTVTKILDKPGLVHWAEKVGINIVQTGLREGWFDPDFAKKAVGSDPDWFTGQHLLDIGKTKRVTNYYMKDAAASRGTSVHKALEYWAMSGELPDPKQYGPEEEGYVRGVIAFLKDTSVEPVMSEVIVASLDSKVAGRFDLLGKIPKDVEVFVHLTDKGRGDKKETLTKGTRIFDLKTSKGVYVDHHLQVTGYDGIMKDSGYPKPDATPCVVRVTPDGRYCIVESRADWVDFILVRELYDSLLRIKGK